MANQTIELDLDDGIKDNYALFQGVEVESIDNNIKKINLLKKL